MHKLVALLIVVIATQAACSRSTPAKDFASAEEALEALVTAAKADGPQALVEVLGPEAKPVIDSGDPVQDRNSREKFLQEYAAAHTLDRSVEGRTTLEVGADEWPFPFPVDRARRALDLRQHGGHGGDRQSPRRCERTLHDSVLPGFCRCRAGVLHAQCAAGHAAAVCSKAREH